MSEAAPDPGAVPIAVWLQNTSFGDVSKLAEHFIDEEFSHLCTFAPLPPLHVPPLPRYRTGHGGLLARLLARRGCAGTRGGSTACTRT